MRWFLGLASLYFCLTSSVVLSHAQQLATVSQPTCEEKLVTEQGWGGETLEIAKLREAGVRAFFRGELAKKDQRITELERQLVEAKKLQETQPVEERKP